MVCTIQIKEKPVLKDPVLIEGLPGIGFVANIATLHLIRELHAELFAEIHSSSFQDLAVTAGNGEARFPASELYYHRGSKGQERDLIILYGNTQALTTFGQYELCGKVLDIAQNMGCNYVITLGGLLREEKLPEPKLYCAASDQKTLKEALNLGAEIIDGQVFGIAGLLVGLCKLWNMEGFCLLAETPGFYPDLAAARQVLNAISKMLHLTVDMDRLELTAKITTDILESFGLVFQPQDEKRRKERHSWHV